VLRRFFHVKWTCAKFFSKVLEQFSEAEMAVSIKDGVGGLAYDKSKKEWAGEWNILAALLLMVLIFELLGWVLLHDSFLFNTRSNLDTIFNNQRLSAIFVQLSVQGIIAVGVTMIIISGGIDLSSGSVLAATAMITMSFGQTLMVNGNPNPKAIFGPWAMDLPVIVPIAVGLLCGAMAGLTNGTLIAYAKLPPFIATLATMVAARGVSQWWSNGQPISFPTQSLNAVGAGLNPFFIFLGVAVMCQLMLWYTKFGKHCYAVGSNEEASRITGVKVENHKMLVYVIAAMLAGLAAVVIISKQQTAQAGMGNMYELDAITMAVIGGVSLSGGRGSVIGTFLGFLMLSVIISGFIFLGVGAYYQLMVKGVIIASAVVLDQWRQRSGTIGRR
jgi:inositol transport system permease protein